MSHSFITPLVATYVTQVAHALRQGLAQRRWIDRLPAELDLAREFQVSRSTLRAALRLLVDEGLLETSKGRQARILKTTRASVKRRAAPTIGILSPYPRNVTKAWDLFQEPLQEQLVNRGFRVELHGSNRFYQKTPGKALAKLINETQVDCWILHFSTLEMQRWFSQRRLPAIIEGTAYTDVALPAVDVDYRAITRHAVGLLLAQGHTQIGLFLPKSRAGGLVRCEEGFAEGLRSHRSSPVQGRVLRSGSSVPEICAALQKVLSAKTKPTALLVVQPVDLFTVLTALMNAGQRIPADLSLICLADAPFLDNLVPSIARYAFTPEVFAKQVTQLAAKIVNGGDIPGTQRLVLPHYQSGQSIGPCPAV